MRTNEELALLMQRGDKGAKAELWEQVEKLIFSLTAKYFPSCSRYRTTDADLLQCGYFAMVRAVNSYKPEKGYKFTSYLSRHVDNVIQEELGIRGHKSRPQDVASLDDEIPGAEGMTLCDTVEDKTAAQAFEHVQEKWYNEQLHNALESCIATLPDMEQVVIRGRYYDGQSLAQLGEVYGVSPEYIRQREGKALRALRHPRHTRTLQSFRDELTTKYGMRHYGYSQFRERGYSGVEWVALRVLEIEETEKKRSEPGSK